MSELTPKQKLVQALFDMKTPTSEIRHIFNKLQTIESTKKSTEPNHSWSKEGF